MMKKTIYPLVAVLLILACCCCKTSKKSVSNGNYPLIGTQWNLSALEGEEIGADFALRPFITFDVLRRYFEHRGYEVTFVQNFTDIDDKMIKRANAEGITVKELISSSDLQAKAMKLVADATPGRLVWQDGGHAVWLNWTLDTEVYVSDPVDGGFTGVWFGGKYVYTSRDSDLSATLADRRAKVTVKIQCSTDLIPQTHLCDVRVTDRIVSDRFYLHEIGDNVQGFSRPADPADPSILQHFFVDTDPDHAVVLTDAAGLPDISDPAGKNVLLEKGVTDWTSSTPFFLQARDYSNALMAGKRPIIEVRLGADPENPVKVRVPLAQNLLPMHHYVYTLDVTNAYVAVYLSVAGWDEVMTGDNAHGGETVTETPAYLGTVQIGDDTWDNGGGGDADKPVNP